MNPSNQTHDHQDLFRRQDFLTADLSRIPGLVQALLEDLLPSSGMRTRPRISGSADRQSAPIRIDLLDEVDELWAVLWELVDELAEQHGEQPPVVRRKQNFANAAGVRIVRGYRTTDRAEIAAHTETVIRWLLGRTRDLSFDHRYKDAVEELQQRLSRLFSIVGLKRWTVYHKIPCELCDHRAVLPEWRHDSEDPKRWVCEHCEHIQLW